MKRRNFVKGAATAGVAAAAASALPAPAISQGLKQWKLAMSWPLNSPGLGTSGQRIAKRISQLSGGKITVKVYGGGELVPAFGVFDAVGAGDADMYHSAEYYWQGKHKAFNYFTAVPYGLTGTEHAAWMNYGGGQELWDELSAQFGLKGFLASSTGTQMGGWYRKPIDKLDDFKGLKFRMPGIGGEVLRALGVTVVNLPVAEIYPALASGAIDAAEWVGPWHDLAFGFHKITKHYYYPGFHEPGTTSSCVMNKKLWDSLTKDEQLLVKTVMEAESYIQFAEFNARNLGSLNVLLNKHGVKLHQYPQDMLINIGKVAGTVMNEIGNTDAFTKRVHESFMTYRKQAIAWAKIGEQGYMNARLLPFKYG
ncbi:MAG: twin-arginine translocation signal domain-containing protein [Alphaproteobacteria bacterium]|nr:twin-arginine translocation signal domain-containing protein [Alphaproteobacteria bacterium]